MIKWLTVPDVVQLLHVPEATIYRWIRQGDIPCTVRHEKYFFNKATLTSWAETKHIYLEDFARKTKLCKQDQSISQPPLVEAIKRGGVFHAVPSETVEIFFQEVAACMNVSEILSNTLADLLLKRENLTSTAIGQGVAIPHPPTPLGDEINQSLVGVFFPENLLDFNATDGEPVFVTFVLLSADATQHLQLLSQLARFLHQSDLNAFLKKSPTLEDLIEQFQKILAS